MADKLLESLRQQSPLEYSKPAKDLLKSQKKDAELTPEQILERDLAYSPKSSSQLLGAQEDYSSRFDKSLGMMPDPIVGDAISARAQRLADADINLMQRQMKLRAPIKKFEATERAARTRNEIVAIKNQFDAIKAQQRARKKAARGQALGTVLGVAGAVVGTAFGGPAGGMAGYAVGSGVGQAVGGSGS